MVCAAEAARALGVVEPIDGFVGSITQRHRGLSAGEIVVSLAECFLGGGDVWADLDRARNDCAAAALQSVARPPASTTARTLAQRFGPDELAGIEATWVETAARSSEVADPNDRERLNCGGRQSTTPGGATDRWYQRGGGGGALYPIRGRPVAGQGPLRRCDGVEAGAGGTDEVEGLPRRRPTVAETAYALQAAVRRQGRAVWNSPLAARAME